MFSNKFFLILTVFLVCSITSVSATQFSVDDGTLYVKQGEMFGICSNGMINYDHEYLQLISTETIPEGTLYTFKALKKGTTYIYLSEYDINAPIVIT